MRIGLDFDNTIVSYDTLFHKVALEQGIIPANIATNKVAVRDYLRAVGREPLWTELQGTIYGLRMDESQVYPGVIEFLKKAFEAGHTLAIISHKTRYPFLGPQYDLHAAARTWVEHHLRENGQPLISAENVFFELTKEKKLARISTFGCDFFFDDLPEILFDIAFPSSTRRALFDPENNHAQETLRDVLHFHSWQELSKWLSR